MKVIRTRSDLLQLALDFAPTNACMTAIRKGGATVLGGFNSAEGHEGWIVQVDTPSGRTWLMFIYGDELQRKFRRRLIADVPWEDWIGDPKGTRLIDGEDPVQFAANRMQAIGGR